MSPLRPPTLKISVSGVRGVVGDSLTPQVVARFAAAFGTYAGRGRVLVGRDARPSGGMLVEAVTAGLLATGCQPVDIGICPIPSALFYTRESQARGAVVATASHNPEEWNGLKFLSGRGIYLNASEVEEFLDIYHQGDFAFVRADRHRPLAADACAVEAHLKRLLQCLDVDRIRSRAFRVAVDCNNGAGAVLLPRFLECLGCEVESINATPGAAFARSSEPVPESLRALGRLVRRARADVGFAQDADADRLAIVDETGRPIGEDLTLALGVQRVLQTTPGPVAVNLAASRAIDDLAKCAGVPVYRTKTGEINVVEEVLRRKAVVGGEGNGGVVWPRVHPCRDSFAAAGLVLELMACSRKNVSTLAGRIPAYAMVKDKVPGTPEEAHRILGVLRKRHEREDVSTLDGLRIAFPDGWVLLRPSNTEPIIRVTAEAKDPRRARALADRFRSEIESSR